MSQLQADLAAIEKRVTERNNAIKRNDTSGEERADQHIIQGLYDAANSCPVNAPDAKKGLLTAANQYQSNTRAGRDHVLATVIKSVLLAKNLAMTLAGAGTLTLTALATPGTALLPDGTAISGQQVDNGDGTSQIIYDSNNNGLVDSQYMIDTQTGVATTSQPESFGLRDLIGTIFDLLNQM